MNSAVLAFFPAVLLATMLLPLAAASAQVTYQPILEVDYSVTGVRGQTTNGADLNVVYTGNGPGGQGLLYVGNLFGGGTTNVLNAFGGVGTTNSLLYGPDTPAFNPSIGAGNIRAVGTYNTTNTGNQLFGALYTGTAAGVGTWLDIQMPDAVAGGEVYNTIPHSVMGDLVVGNFNIVGSNASPGSGFIYNMSNSSYQTINLPGGGTTSLYGVWQNGIGSSSYTLIGGTAVTAGLTKALIMGFDSSNLSFTNITEIAIAPDAFLSHFEGITAAEGGFNVVGMTTSTNGAGEWFGFIATNGSGFSTNVQWTSLEYPDADTTTANTVYGNYAIGVFVDSGAGGEQPYVATVPEPSTFALLLLGAGVAGWWVRRRS
jgi:hypothetical protein